jgi:hypothetical protein
MKVEEIAEAIAMLPPDQLARFRRWFAAFEACRSDHAKELDSTAIKLGRLAGRALAELRRRVEEPYSGPIELPSARQSSEIRALQSPGNGTLRHLRPGFFFKASSFSYIAA